MKIWEKIKSMFQSGVHTGTQTGPQGKSNFSATNNNLKDFPKQDKPFK